MTIQKLLQKNQLPHCIKLGRGSYSKEPCKRYNLQRLTVQNSIQYIAGAACKAYKTT